ncbi:App1 family protein [uncultured Pseudokineococcus sp.]|uniref:App1 family protein n=1 Tax=uncultured Pseudokineococcus sp. TaxID=1642928 RepID=UPI00261455B9|nr:phosphatase domain-containing protein [uncultured Pseudokineococcus sp.]
MPSPHDDDRDAPDTPEGRGAPHGHALDGQHAEGHDTGGHGPDGHDTEGRGPGHAPADAPRGVRLAYAAQTGVRDAVAALARRAGWTPALLSYPGLGGPRAVRVLGRVLLAPRETEPSRRVGVPGWQRFLTLELPDQEVQVRVGGVSTTVRSDSSGLLDAVVDVELAPGPAEVELRVPGRPPLQGVVHVVRPGAVRGVVCDVDDTVWVTGLSTPLLAAWRTVARSSADRHPVPGIGALLRAVVQDVPHAPVVYLSNGAWNLNGPVVRFLRRHRFPAGPVLMTDWGVLPESWFRDGRRHKRETLERLVHELPDVRWVLVGDDGEHDPDIYRDLARRFPSSVEAVAIRQVGPGATASVDHEGEVPVVSAPDGRELLERLAPLLEDRAGERA